MTVMTPEGRAPRKTNRSSRIFWPLYVSAWMLLAGGSLAYLALVANDPSLTRRVLSIAGYQPAEPSDDPHSSAKIAAELETLRATVSKIDNELSGVKSSVAKQSRTVEEVSKKVASANPPPAEETPAGSAPTNNEPAHDGPTSNVTTGALPDRTPMQPLIRVGRVRTVTTTPTAATEEPPPPADVAPPAVTATPSPTPPPAKASTRRLPPLPTRVQRTAASNAHHPHREQVAGYVKPEIINGGSAPASTTVTTGSIPTVPKPAPARKVKKRAAKPVAAKAPPPTITFGSPEVHPVSVPPAATAITLSRASTLDGLRASWTALSHQHPNLLGGLQPRYAREVGGTYRLLAGPLGSHADADRLCNALRTGNVPCGIAAYAGNAL